MHFSTDSARGFPVPSAWTLDSCVILINNVRPHAEGTFPIALLAHLAAEVTESCIRESPANLGGDVGVGSGMDFDVTVAGLGTKSGEWGFAGNASDVAVAKERRSNVACC